MTDRREDDVLLPALDGEPGPALPIDDGAMRAMIAAALDGGGGGPGGDGGSAAGGGGLSIAVKSGLVALGAAAAVIAVLALSGVFDRERPASPAVIEPDPDSELAVAPELVEPEPIEPEPIEPEPGPSEPEPIVIEPERVEPPPPKPKRPASPAPEPAAKTPDDLLRLANEARKRRAWSDANAIYRQVWKEHPGTRAAYVARVASAQLELGKLDRPAAALAGFRAALRQDPDGFLTEEARFGVAQGLRALGKRADEREALERFLSEHPDSAHAPRARARLAELPEAP